jgi:flavin-dependent dehydrogenase
MGAELTVSMINQRIEPTLSTDQMTQRSWPVIIAGAGAAGAVTALSLLEKGITPLIIEKSSLPRNKTCGGCLNPAARAALGLDPLLESQGGRLLDHFQLHVDGKKTRIRLDTHGAMPLAMSRQRLDAALLRLAVERGAHYIDRIQVTASSLEMAHRRVHLRSVDGMRLDPVTDCVVACDGLNSALARAEGFKTRRGLHLPPVKPKFGMSCLLPPESVRGVEPNTISMVVGDGLYAGIVCIEEGWWNMAAAVRTNMPGKVSPREMICKLLSRNLVDIDGEAWKSAEWVTCPQFPHRVSQPAAERILLAGDSAGYVEPFTGEGMARAMISARLAAECLANGWQAQTAGVYTAMHGSKVARRQKLVATTAWLAGYPKSMFAAIDLLRRIPRLGRMVMHRLNRVKED